MFLKMFSQWNHLPKVVENICCILSHYNYPSWQSRTRGVSPEVRIYKEKQESKKKRKESFSFFLSRERVFFLFFLVHFLGRKCTFLFSYFLL